MKESTDFQELLNKEDFHKEINSFKEFAFKKNTIEIAIAFILGGSFNKVVKSVSDNIIMPIVNAILSHTGESWREASWELSDTVSIEYGLFLGSFIDFFITAIILYVVYVKITRKILPTKGLTE